MSVGTLIQIIPAIPAIFSIVVFIIQWKVGVSLPLSLRRRQFASVLMQHYTVRKMYNSMKEAVWDFAMSVRPLRESWPSFIPLVVMVGFTLHSCSHFKGYSQPLVYGYLAGITVEVWVLLDSLIDKSSIRRGSGWSYLTFFILFVIVLWKTPLSKTQKTWEGILPAVMFIFLVIVYMLFSRIIDQTARQFWKMVIASEALGEEFAGDLPHLIVKTKNGNIFFGQLYYPLDKKLLILRKAKIVAHNGSDVSGIIDGLVVQSVPYLSDRENYLTIPWDNIEALQIVEKGLYA